MKILLILLLMSSVVHAGDWNMGYVEEEIKGLKEKDQDLQKQIDDLNKRLGDWNFGIPSKGDIKRGPEACPCPEGKCICPDGKCDCPDCPVHGKKKNTVVPSGLENQDGIEIHGVSWKGTEPTNKGDELLYFGASWCANCPAAITRLADMTKDIYYIDCSEKGGRGDTLAGMHMVDSYPTLIHIRNGFKVDSHHTEGDSVGKYLANLWLNGKESEPVRNTRSTARTYNDNRRSISREPGPNWTWPGDLRQHLESTHGQSTAGLSESELRDLHDNLHNRERYGSYGYSRPAARPMRSYAAPMYRQSYQPQQYFTPSYCPSCVR